MIIKYVIRNKKKSKTEMNIQDKRASIDFTNEIQKHFERLQSTSSIGEDLKEVEEDEW